jgi:hypothetical protein
VHLPRAFENKPTIQQFKENVKQARLAPVALLDPVFSHDVQDPHPDLLRVAPPSRKRPHGEPRKPADGGVACGAGLGMHALCKGLVNEKDHVNTGSSASKHVVVFRFL